MNWHDGLDAADRAFLEALDDKEITGDPTRGIHVVAGGVALTFTKADAWQVTPHWEGAEGQGATAETAYVALVHNVEGAALQAQTRVGRLRSLCERVVMARAYRER